MKGFIKTNKFTQIINKHASKLCILLLFLIIAALYPRKIDIEISDIGRHIKNGEVFFREFKVLSTNYYSYSYPDYPFETHHWGAGVFYYIIWKVSGFNGLIIFNALLMMLAVWFYFMSAQRLTNWRYAFLFTTMALPLIMFRVEVRPETFSYMFMGLVFYLMVLFEKGRISFKWILPILFLISIFWVNIHLFFVFGFAIVGSYLVKSLIFRDNKAPKYVILLVAMVGGSMVSPFGIHSFLEPFMIFNDYEMAIAENQPIPLFVEGSLFGNLYYFYFKIIFIIGVFSFIAVLLKKKIRENIIGILLFIAFSVASWKIGRTATAFSLIMIPVLASTHQSIINEYGLKFRTLFYAFYGYVIINFFFVHFIPMYNESGIGLRNPSVNKAAEYFKRNNLKGPILNNMNIGSYLIFYLFPEEQVFYDARPEAYPGTFIREEYRPMMQDVEKWQKALDKYKFNVIVFNVRVLTEYEAEFINERAKDPMWKLAFNDQSVAILIRNEPAK